MFFGQLGFSLQIGPDSLKVYEDTIYLQKKRALEKAYATQSESEIVALHNDLGDYYQNALLYSEAIEQYNEVLQNITGFGADSLKFSIYNKIASIHLQHKNYSKAREYLQEVFQPEKKTYMQAVAEGLMGSCYEKEGNYLKALEHQYNSLSIFKQIKNQNGLALVNENIGSIYEDLKQFDKAYTYFEKANSYFLDTKSPEQISVLNNLGDVYRKTGRYDQAIKFSTQALNLAKAYNDYDQLESAHKDLSEIYMETGEFEKAYGHLLRYDEIQNEILNAENLRQLNTLQAIYDTREKEAEIDLLTKQNQVNKANQNLLLGGTCALILISGGFYYNLQRKRKDRNKVQQYEQELLQVQLDKKAIEEKKLNDEIHLKTASLSKYSLNMAQKNKLIADVSATLKNIAARPKMEVKDKLKNLVRELDSNLEQSEEWDEFMGYFKEIHPQFFKSLNAQSSGKLTPTEYRLAMLLRLKMSSKEIAAILRITPDSVRVGRYRFRKKLPINADQKLSQFLQEL